MLAEAEDGCDANNPCTDPTAPCCSRFGHCGFDEFYCGKDCQSQCELPPSPLASEYACGRMASSTLCPNPENPCCSKYGYCGNDIEHCGYGCQSQCDSGGSSSLPSSGSSFLFFGRRGFLNYSSFLCCPIPILSDYAQFALVWFFQQTYQYDPRTMYVFVSIHAFG